MLLDILDFLLSQHYVELIYWAQAVSEKYFEKLNEAQKHMIKLLRSADFDHLYSVIQKQSYINIQNETYSLILKELNEHIDIIKDEWNFLQKFSATQDYANIVCDQNIIAFAHDPVSSSTNIIESTSTGDLLIEPDLSLPPNWRDQLHFLKQSPEILWIGGNQFQPMGLNSTANLQNILEESQIQQELQKYSKYEKIALFIENLDFSLQKLFSLHQIGVIIYHDELYLIKWVQYLDEQQFLTGENQKSQDIVLLEDFGVKIGVKLRDDLTLGNLVVFKTSTQQNQEVERQLQPLISLSDHVLEQMHPDNKKTYNLGTYDDCVQFIEAVNARIEAGILLLTQRNDVLLETTKDVSTYIEISLERVEGLESINQRINLLKDLYRLAPNPTYLQKIRIKLEKNYLLYLKMQFKIGNMRRIPEMIRMFTEYKLYTPNPNILVHTLVFLFEKYYVKSTIILGVIEYLYNNWELSDQLKELLQSPQLIALSNEIIQMIEQHRISYVIPYLKKYLVKHPELHSFSLLSLNLQILLDIYKPRKHGEEFIFKNSDFIAFLSELLEVFPNFLVDLSNSDQQALKVSVKDTFMNLSLDLDFHIFINDKFTIFINLCQNFKENWLSKKDLYLIIQNFAQYSSIVIFRNKLATFAFQLFQFFSETLHDPTALFTFIEQFFVILTKSSQVIQENPYFFQDVSKILTKIHLYIESHSELTKLELIPLRRVITHFLTQWYIEGELPQQNFSIHKIIIEEWIDFIGLKPQLHAMLSMLSIQDLIWDAKKQDLFNFQQKYQNLPLDVFESYSAKIFREFMKILDEPFQSLEQFGLIFQIFLFCQSDFTKLHLSYGDFEELLAKYENFTIHALEDSIRMGIAHNFRQILRKCYLHFPLFSSHFYSTLHMNFTRIFFNSLVEGRYFTHRVKMIKTTKFYYNKILTEYDKIIDIVKLSEEMKRRLLSMQFVTQQRDQLHELELDLLNNAQEWLIHISIKEYITTEEVLKPISILFKNFMQDSSHTTSDVIENLKILLNQFFTNQSMLNSNKKLFFIMMRKLFPEDAFPEFYPTLRDYTEFINELAELETLYFSLRDGDLNKTKKVNERSLKLIAKYPHLFSPWYYHANCLIILGKYSKAIEAFYEALKYESSQSNYSRLYYNMIVAYLSMNKIQDAIGMVGKLPIGVKTFPYISEIIRKIEEITGNTL